MRIVCLPIDSRPCNTQFVRSLAEWGGAECVLPRAEEMDYFRRPAPFEGSQAFLKRELPHADAAVISLEHWCFGGLLASREEIVPEEDALARVRMLRELLRANPDTRVYLSTILMRSSISTLCRDDLEAYRAMTDYSIHTARYARLRLDEDWLAARNAAARIPARLLEKMLEIRRRNLNVNLAAIDLAAEGLIHSLSILQEDTQTDGLPKRDQAVIRRYLSQRGAKNVFLRNGTDEAGSVSVARAIREGKAPLPVSFRWMGDADFIAPYEDRPFRENLESACGEIGIVPAEESGIRVLICCPEPGAPESESIHTIPEDYLRSIARAADEEIAAGKKVYLLDIIRPNGGAFSMLRRMKRAEELWGYSAWNTASNSMGTLLAQVVTDREHGAPNRVFLRERMLDDGLYQGYIRQELEPMLEKAGEDPLCLRDKAAVEKLLREIFDHDLARVWPMREIPDVSVSLPWDRIFEVRAEVLS